MPVVTVHFLYMAIAANSFWPEFMRNEASQAVCQYIAIRGGAALGATAGGLIGSNFGPGGTIAGGRIGRFIGGAGGAGLGAYLCPSQPPGVGEFPLNPEPPFIGGQCAGTFYSFRMKYTTDGVLNDVTQQGQLVGPVFGPRVRELGNNRRNLEVVFTGQFSPFVQESGTTKVVKIVSFELVPPTSGPDNCGSLPPDDRLPIPGRDFPPPGSDPAGRRPINIDVDFGNNNIINVDGDLILGGLHIGPNGLVANFNFNGVGFSFNPRTGDIDLGFGRPNPQQPPLEPSDDPSRILSGVYYTCIANESKASYIALNNGRYYFPRVGSLRFIGSGEQSEELQMNGEKGFVVNPSPNVFRGYTITKDKGIESITTRPLWEDTEVD